MYLRSPRYSQVSSGVPQVRLLVFQVPIVPTTSLPGPPASRVPQKPTRPLPFPRNKPLRILHGSNRFLQGLPKSSSDSQIPLRFSSSLQSSTQVPLTLPDPLKVSSGPPSLCQVLQGSLKNSVRSLWVPQVPFRSFIGTLSPFLGLSKAPQVASGPDRSLFVPSTRIVKQAPWTAAQHLYFTSRKVMYLIRATHTY